MQISDAQLITACRRGDEAAWESLVLRYQKLIYAIPRRAGLNEDDSAEVFQDVFTALLRKLNTIEEPERLHAWLVTTARRMTWRVISKTRSWQQIGEEGSEEGDTTDVGSIPDSGVLPDASLIELEEQHRIRTAVTGLDERCRRLIELLFYQESPASYSEIGQALNIPEGSVGPTRARCLGKILRLLEKL